MFDNTPEIRYRAVRDMGLAAWFGGAMSQALTLNAIRNSVDDEREAYRVIDEAMKESALMHGGSIAAYLIGTGLVADEGKLLDENGVPRLVTNGPHNAFRASMAGTAVAATVTNRLLRRRILANAEAKDGDTSSDDSDSLKAAMEALQWLIAGLTAWLLFSHIKEDVRSHHGG